MSSSTASLIDRMLAVLPSGVVVQVRNLLNRQNRSALSTRASRLPRTLRQGAQRNLRLRNLLNLPHLFVAVWVLLLLWGERWVFQRSIDECRWENWERWPKDATPHHLVFIADPQLVDPHTYPGRPWPLSTATILHTDNYLKRAYINLQKKLHPDTLFFLGDLFDGGREWKTARGNTADPSWANGQRPSGEQALVKHWGKRYGEDFWLKEYDRFGRIFYKYWDAGGANARPWQRGRKVISTLPGNHDLGFGDKIKVPIRNRFEVYFGEGNRVDVIGNHTFVSVDAVSLSAGGSEHETAEITKPVEEFLSHVQATKRKAIARELSLLSGAEKTLQYSHMVEDVSNADFTHLPTLDPGPGSVDLPTVLLTHVPLYRNPGTPCGPLREHWPPATPPKGQTTPVFPDDRNAISVSKGWQYQNVLSESDSKKLISTIGNVVSVFSGDDHDYCELVHPEDKNYAREITVKSMSWAMGVRRPGFLMLSMWNPIGPDGSPLHSSPSGHGANSPKLTTTESHLCLLPDQIGILIRYGLFLALTIIFLIGRAILVPILNLVPFSSPPTDFSEIELPMSSKDLKRREDIESNESNHFSNSSTSSTSSNPTSNLAPRSSAARTRSVSPASGYGLPSSQAKNATPLLVNNSGNSGYRNNGHLVSDKWRDESENPRAGMFGMQKKTRKDTAISKVWRDIWESIWRVTWIVLIMYFYLVWFG